MGGGQEDRRAGQDCCVGGGCWRVVGWWSVERRPLADTGLVLISPWQSGPGAPESVSPYEGRRDVEDLIINLTNNITLQPIVVFSPLFKSWYIHTFIYHKTTFWSGVLMFPAFIKRNIIVPLLPSFIHGIYFGLTETDNLKWYFVIKSWNIEFRSASSHQNHSHSRALTIPSIKTSHSEMFHVKCSSRWQSPR